jgi:predicted RNase H-like nuclease (RuvC/YqgF family)
MNESKVIQLITERDSLKNYIRELEQKNDDLERTNRVVSESVSGFEAMLNQAYEKNAMLEMEIDEKEQMQVNLQRLMDEARGGWTDIASFVTFIANYENLFVYFRSQTRTQNSQHIVASSSSKDRKKYNQHNFFSDKRH